VLVNRLRDYQYKRAQYAQCGIPEYWIIDPGDQSVLVLSLEGNLDQELGKFRAV
jgi:Uma2 family endonuclease